ncbi:MAG TPA: site-2 protease family protein [Bryobacteraceae bacterium]|nr:site-2 protease family protein [Bryobacteraceae bacterium]
MPAALLPAHQPSLPEPTGTPAWSAASLRLACYAALLLAGLALGLLLGSFGPPWTRPLFAALSMNTPAALAATLAATAAALLIHELGHVLAAVLLDFQILGVSLGPVRLQWLHGKHAFRFSVGRLFSGSVAALPRDMQNWRKRTMWVIAAGPAATLAASIAAGCVVILQLPEVVPHTFWSALAQINFLIFVLGFIPNGARAPVRNDSTLFWTLLHDGPEARELELVYRIGQLRLHAIRPADYPETLMGRLAAFRAHRPDTKVLLARTLADWALDSGDVRAAGLWDREAIAHVRDCDPRLRNSTLAASACFDLIFRDDATAARAKFAEVDLDELFPPCFAHRARAARLLAVDLPHRAPAEIIRAQYALPLGLSYYDFERMLLARVHLQALAVLPVETGSHTARRAN